MDLSFRQGIVRHQTSLNGPAWLQKTSFASSTVDLRADQEPTVIAFAHYGADYLVEETQSVTGAWGGQAAHSSNGPLPNGTTSYLYWDIDLGTGQLSRGWTAVPWIATTAEPLNPVNDLHWFDLNTNRMKVYRKPGNSPGFWQDRVRVFAGVLHSNAVLVPYSTGTQVGLNTPCQAGNLMLGTNGVPLKQTDGTFVTSSSKLTIQQTSGQNVQFDAALVYGQAAEEIPAFYLVSFQADKTIRLASSNDAYAFVAGMVVEPLYEQEVGTVVSNGRVRNDQWNFTPDQIGKALFCGPSGQLMLTPPPIGTLQQVGVVYDTDEVFLNIMSPVRLQLGQGKKPIIVEPDGIQGQLPDGGIINAGGTSHSTFTVNGRGLLFDDGTSTGGGGGGNTGATLQTVYNNSENIDGQAGITLSEGKDFVIKDPFSDGNYFSIAADNGEVRINGNLIVTGSTTTVDTIVTEGNTLKLSPNAGIVTPFIIEPDLGITPIVDLVTIRRSFGGAPVFRIDANGNMISSKDFTIAGLINGVDIVALNTNFQKHLNGQAGFRHQAPQVDILPIASIPGAQNVQQALSYIGDHLGSGGTSTTSGYSHVQQTPSAMWMITHNAQTLRAQVTIYDTNYEQIIPNSVRILNANTIQVSFTSPQVGSAVVILF